MRILFIDFDGVLHAATGPADRMRRFIWAPILRDLLAQHPDVQVVVHASARDHTPAETIASQLGAVGISISGVAAPRISRWEAIQKYLENHLTWLLSFREIAQRSFCATQEPESLIKQYLKRF